jgi:hypothetical protein
MHHKAGYHRSQASSATRPYRDRDLRPIVRQMHSLDDPTATPADAALAAVAEAARALADERRIGDPRDVVCRAALAVAGADLAVLRLEDGVRIARRPGSGPLPASLQGLPPGPGVPQTLLDATGCHHMHVEPFPDGLLAVAWREHIERLPHEVVAALRVLADLAAVARDRSRERRLAS